MSTDTMPRTFWLPTVVRDTPEHRFDLTGDHTGVTGVCVGCGFVITGITTVEALWDAVASHCEPVGG